MLSDLESVESVRALKDEIESEKVGFKNTIRGNINEVTSSPEGQASAGKKTLAPPPSGNNSLDDFKKKHGLQ